MFKQSRKKKIHSTAKASKAVYQPSDKRSAFTPDGYRIDTALSNKRTVTLVDDTNKKVIQGFRGTQSKNDIKDDILMGMGLNRYTKSYKQAYDSTLKAQNKYKGYDTTLTGHSLGAKRSLDIGNRLNLKTVAYDAPGSVWDLSWKNALYNTVRPNKNNKLYMTAGDPVSLGSYFSSGKKKVSLPKGKNVHTIDNYL
ncbi:MAG: hypothetical protein RLY43_2189 [Bacteroidota bacterium]|jgi:putative lipase involved disintegration of autophagic bodies